MNWKLIFSLSLFGLAMAFATVYVIPSTIEPFFWLAIFILCAYIIAKNCSSKYFLHGLMVSIVNSVWIIAAHILLYDTYISGHAQEAAMLATIPFPDGSKMRMFFTMLVTGIFIGVLSGLVLGLFAFIASKIVKKQDVQK